MAERKTAGRYPGSQDKDRTGRDSPSVVKNRVSSTSHFLASGSPSTWYDGGLRGLIGAKVAIRRILAAVAVAEADRTEAT